MKISANYQGTVSENSKTSATNNDIGPQEKLGNKGKIDLSSGEFIKVEFSTEGMEASKQREKVDIKDYIVQMPETRKSLNFLPESTGIPSADKAIASAIDGCSEKEMAFVYNIIRQNFLVEDSKSMTEEERLANISLGKKKAEYAAKTFVPEDKQKSFLDAMEKTAKLAAAGKVDDTFKDINTDSKESFIEGLRAFQLNRPDFLDKQLYREFKIHFAI